MTLRDHRRTYWQAIAACARKRRYATKAKACGAIAFMFFEGRADVGLEAYRCPCCRRWHIGHPTGRDLRAKYQ